VLVGLVLGVVHGLVLELHLVRHMEGVGAVEKVSLLRPSLLSGSSPQHTGVMFRCGDKMLGGFTMEGAETGKELTSPAVKPASCLRSKNSSKLRQ
jgi:hypothetical protein